MKHEVMALFELVFPCHQHPEAREQWLLDLEPSKRDLLS